MWSLARNKTPNYYLLLLSGLTLALQLQAGDRLSRGVARASVLIGQLLVVILRRFTVIVSVIVVPVMVSVIIVPVMVSVMVMPVMVSVMAVPVMVSVMVVPVMVTRIVLIQTQSASLSGTFQDSSLNYQTVISCLTYISLM